MTCHTANISQCSFLRRPLRAGLTRSRTMRSSALIPLPVLTPLRLAASRICFLALHRKSRCSSTGHAQVLDRNRMLPPCTRARYIAPCASLLPPNCAAAFPSQGRTYILGEARSLPQGTFLSRLFIAFSWCEVRSVCSRSVSRLRFRSIRIVDRLPDIASFVRALSSNPPCETPHDIASEDRVRFPSRSSEGAGTSPARDHQGEEAYPLHPSRRHRPRWLLRSSRRSNPSGRRSFDRARANVEALVQVPRDQRHSPVLGWSCRLQAVPPIRKSRDHRPRQSPLLPRAHASSPLLGSSRASQERCRFAQRDHAPSTEGGGSCLSSCTRCRPALRLARR